MSLKHYLQLVRAPNVFTAVTNVFTGCAAVSALSPPPIVIALLALSSACLYAGGVALNDYCDLEVDRTERPKRPLPSGQIAPNAALALAAALLAVGVVLASVVGAMPALTASAIVLLVATYNLGLKQVRIVGPLNMGACRFGNVLLGACAAPGASMRALPFAAFMMGWVVVISLISAREVAAPRLQTVVKAMVLAIPLLDGVFVGTLTTPWLGLGVVAFALPAWLTARRLYVT
ncbi:MAG: UbiA family prenyltransferase [Verrucomicrobia bacterium]|nr:UbiA family prenyltransferase [Verrucomicrobiota bacterium]